MVWGTVSVKCAPESPLIVLESKAAHSQQGDDAPDIGDALHLTRSPQNTGVSKSTKIQRAHRRLKFSGGCSETDSSISAVLDCTNAVRKSPDAFANDYPCYYDSWRNEAIGKSLGPLQMDGTLIQMAQLHTDDQARINAMSHTGSDGSTLSIRADRVNYRWSSLGENVAVGYDSAKDVVMAWMCSEGHRKNLLSCTFDTIGIGMAQSVAGRRYFTQNFGCAMGHSCSCSAQSSSGFPGSDFPRPTSSFFEPSPSSHSNGDVTGFPGFQSTNFPDQFTPSPSPPVPSPPWWADQFFSPSNEEPVASPSPDATQFDPIPSPSALPGDTVAQGGPGELNTLPMTSPSPEPSSFDTLLNRASQSSTLPLDTTDPAVEPPSPALPDGGPLSIPQDTPQTEDTFSTSVQPDPVSNTDPTGPQQWRWSCDWVGPNWSCERVLGNTGQPSTSTDPLRSSAESFTIG